MTVEMLERIMSIASDAATVVVVLVGGAWAFYHFVLRRISEPNPQIELKHQVLPYSQDNALLVVLASVRNIGNVPVRLQEGRSLTLSLKALPSYRAPGTLLHWNDGDFIVRDLDIVKDANPDHSWSSEEYWLEPGGEYQEVIPVVVPWNLPVIAEVSLQGACNIDIWAYAVWVTAKDETIRKGDRAATTCANGQ
jgi:hypothetical protein